MKSLLGVLCLGLVLVYSRADHHHDCHKTLGSEELHQVDGDWVLVGTVLDKTKGAPEEMLNMTSSHLTTRVQPDNHTLTVTERNSDSGGKCVEYHFSLVLSQTPSIDGHHHLDLANATETRDGETKPYTDKDVAQFYHSDKDSVMMSYHSDKYGDFIALYIREGQHLDVTEKHHEDLRAMAKCLHMEGENFTEWNYHGADFCHKKSVLPTLDSDELHQVQGHWVLMWMGYDKVKSHNDPALHFNSSFLDLDVQPDNHTVALREQNLIGDKCISYEANLVLPQHSERIHRLHLDGAMEFIDGVAKPFLDNATAEFFPSEHHSLVVYYKSEKNGPFLLIYRRDGQHVHDLEKEHEKYREKAKYLGVGGENFEEWSYKGLADFCHKKSVPPTLDSDELHKVNGEWDLIWSTYDKVKNQEEHWVNTTSSRMEFNVDSDNHTVHMHERNLVGEKIFIYKGKLVLPQDSEKIHRLHLEDGKMIHEGVETSDNDTAAAVFFEASDNHLLLLYKSQHYGRFLLFYSKVGHHLAPEELEKEHEKYKELLKYLGMSEDDYTEWHFTEVAATAPPSGS